MKEKRGVKIIRGKRNDAAPASLIPEKSFSLPRPTLNTVKFQQKYNSNGDAYNAVCYRDETLGYLWHNGEHWSARTPDEVPVPKWNDRNSTRDAAIEFLIGLYLERKQVD